MVKSSKTALRQHFNLKHVLIAIISLAVIASITGIIIALANAPHCRGLVGTWKLNSDAVEGNYTLLFRAGNTGIDNQDGTTYDFTYTDHQGVFDLLYPEDSIPSSYSYYLSDNNNVLTLQDSEGEDVIYICQ